MRKPSNDLDCVAHTLDVCLYELFRIGYGLLLISVGGCGHL